MRSYAPADIEWARHDELALGTAEIIWYESGNKGSVLAADREVQDKYFALALEELDDAVE